MAASEFEVKLAAVLRRQIAGFEAFVSAERLSGGASQETYRLVIRDRGRRAPARDAPRAGRRRERAWAWASGFATEAQLMRSARDAGVPEPEVYAVLEPGDGLGDGFVMEWLDGEALGARIVRARIVGGGAAEARVRMRPDPRAHPRDRPEETGLDQLLDPMDPAAFVEQTWERYKLFDTPQPMIDYAGRWLKEHLPKHPRTTLVHNDFRNGNFMVGPNGVVAVLDWEVAHIGDPMRDLGWICTNSWRFGRSDLPVGGFGEYADLFRGYESVSGSEGRSGAREVLGSVRLVLVGRRLSRHGGALPHRSRQNRRAARRSAGAVRSVRSTA